MVACSLPATARVAGHDLQMIFCGRGDAVEESVVVMMWKFFVAF